jgi:hypothetical protein
MTALYRPQFLPDLLVPALSRNGERPCVFIDHVLTAREVAQQISRYIQVDRNGGLADE